MTEEDTRDLRWFLGQGLCAFQRSTFGDMLERAERLAFDSRGNLIPRPDRSSWHTVMPKVQHGEPSYTPNERELVRAAGVSRRLRRLPDWERRVLEVYYGDQGARWPEDPMFALFPLTLAGRKYVGENRIEDTRDIEIIAALRLAQKSKPSSERGHLLRMGVEAKAMLTAAHEAWDLV